MKMNKGTELWTLENISKKPLLNIRVDSVELETKFFMRPGIKVLLAVKIEQLFFL